MNKKHSVTRILILLFLIFSFIFRPFVSYAATGINEAVNLQGKVVNSDGTNVTDGTYDFVFKIYDGGSSGASTLFTESWTSSALWSSTMSSAPSSGGESLTYSSDTNESTIKVGQVLWNTTKAESVVVTSVNTSTNVVGISPTRQAWSTGDTVTNKIYVKDGIFRVAVNSLNQDLSGVDFNSDTLFMGVNFNADGEMKPRLRFTAVPYAMNAKKVNGLNVTATTGTLTIPNGSTIAFSGANNLTMTTTGTTNVTLPTTGTLSTLAGSETFTNKIIGSTGLTFSGASTDITTGTNEDLAIMPNGTGKVGIGTTAPISFLDLEGAVTGKALAIFNETGDQALFTASAAGIPKFTIAHNGNVGIGTTSPAAAIDIKSTGTNTDVLKLIAADGSRLGRFTETSGGTGWFEVDDAVGAAVALLRGDGGASYLSNGTFGIGTSSPVGKLHVSGAVAGKALAIFDETGDQALLTASASGSTKFIVDHNGNVGIGVTNPGAPLDVRGVVYLNDGGSAGAPQLTFWNDNNTGLYRAGGDILSFVANGQPGLTLDGTAGVGRFLVGSRNSQPVSRIQVIDDNNNTASGITFGESASTYMQIYKSASNKLNIAGGNVGIGNASALATLDVNGSASVSGNLSFASGARTIAGTAMNQLIFGDSNTGDLVLQPKGSAAGIVQVGTGGTGSTTPDFLALDVKSTTGDPSGGFEGAMYYNTFDNKFRCYQGSAWTDCIGSGVGGSSSWSSLTDPSGNLALSMGSNTTTFTYGSSTGSNDLFKLTDTTSNTGTGYLFNLTTASSSTLKPLHVVAAGTEALAVDNNGRVGIGVTNPAYKLDVTSADTTGILQLTGNSVTTGTGLNLLANGLTTGKAMNISSTSTGLTTGNLLSVDWSPGSATTATGDLFSLNVGANGVVGTLLNLKNNGASIFSVSQSLISAGVPVNFGAAGDVSIAYDLTFTNQTASYIKSNAPLYLETGESFESNDLTLRTFNSGNIIADLTGSGGFSIGSSITPTGKFHVEGAMTGKALAIFNETGDQALLTASASGTTKFIVDHSGNVGIGTTSPLNKLDVNGAVVLGTYAGTSTGPSNGLAVSGNVGIGTTAPNNKLEVVSTTSPQVRVAYDTSNYLTVGVASNGSVTLDATGSGAGLTVADALTASSTLTSTGALTVGSGGNTFTFDPATGPLYAGNARPAKTIKLSPEYQGAALTASGSATTNGTMTSDTIRDSTAGWMNYYEWTSTQGSLQDYTIVVKVTLPSDFGAWATSNALQINYATENTSTSKNKLDVSIYNMSTNPDQVVYQTLTNASGTNGVWTTVTVDKTLLGDGVSPDWNAAGQTALIFLKPYSLVDAVNCTGGVDNGCYVRIGDIVLNYIAKF